MANSKLWSPNPNYLSGALFYDDASTTYDAAIPYDSVTPDKLANTDGANPAAYTNQTVANGAVYTVADD